eukprot:TRINITY_DN4096_c0_g1_i1.p1 TRINITY_DN4096_c0_g1~~TRINITY_DN4096_c0_g1_i1.p1  ORF type:complete len:903 (+),score=256.02 TRINITY_DN4096_c0_g1_i1:23-2731(+)
MSNPDDFLSRVDEVSDLVRALKENKGGIDLLNEFDEKDRKHEEKLANIRKDVEERKKNETKKERETWWEYAHMKFEESDDEDENLKNNDRYNGKDRLDYSRWDEFVRNPDDPVSLAEKEEMEKKKQDLQDAEFEKLNPEFCDQFKEDLKERQKTDVEKETEAENLRVGGNKAFKEKLFDIALKHYQRAMKLRPFKVPLLTNMALVHYQLGDVENCLEFCNRAIYIDPKCVKAYFKRAMIAKERQKYEKAIRDLEYANIADPKNKSVMKELKSLKSLVERAKEEKEVAEAFKTTQNVMSSLNVNPPNSIKPSNKLNKQQTNSKTSNKKNKKKNSNKSTNKSSSKVKPEEFLANNESFFEQLNSIGSNMDLVGISGALKALASPEILNLRKSEKAKDDDDSDSSDDDELDSQLELAYDALLSVLNQKNNKIFMRMSGGVDLMCCRYLQTTFDSSYLMTEKDELNTREPTFKASDGEYEKNTCVQDTIKVLSLLCDDAFSVELMLHHGVPQECLKRVLSLNEDGANDESNIVNEIQFLGSLFKSGSSKIKSIVLKNKGLKALLLELVQHSSSRSLLWAGVALVKILCEQSELFIEHMNEDIPNALVGLICDDKTVSSLVFQAAAALVIITHQPHLRVCLAAEGVCSGFVEKLKKCDQIRGLACVDGEAIMTILYNATVTETQRQSAAVCSFLTNELRSAGITEILINHLRESKGDDISIIALHLLARLCSNNEEILKEVVTSEDIRRNVIDELFGRIDEPQIIESVIRMMALSQKVLNNDISVFITPTFGFRVGKIVSKYSTVFEVSQPKENHQLIVRLLTNLFKVLLVLGGNEKAIQNKSLFDHLISKYNLIEVLIEAVKRNKESRQNAAVLLGKLAKDSTNIQKIRDLRGIEILMEYGKQLKL